MTQDRPRAGTKENLRDIIEAIKTLKYLEATGREAGPKDKAKLSKFTGFGAVARTAFPDPVSGAYAPGWESLGRELRELLTDDEYASAKATTFSAFYTSDLVTREMFRALERMGVESGSRGLEPGCGVGNFLHAAPDGLEFIGVEQDSLSGRMAKLIHPGHEIRVEAFQDSNLPEGSVDFAIGNVPFADIKLRYKGQRHSLHDYFFLKSLDAVRPGGVLAFVTSRYTLDKASPAVRELLAEQADFVGALRLPGEAFKDQGTEVVTDIVFLRKKPLDRAAEAPEWADERWLGASDAALEGGEIRLNDYFQAHPERVLGRMSVGQGMYHNQDLRVRSDGELAAALHAAVDGLPENICTRRSEPLAAAARISAAEGGSPEGVKEGSFFIADDKTIMQLVGGEATPVMQGGQALTSDGTPGGQRLAYLIRLRDRARAVLKTQQEGRSDEVKESARRGLRQTYAGFVSRFGPINKTTMSERSDGSVVRRMPNIAKFKGDPDAYLVMALEEYNEQTNTARPAAIMRRDVVAPVEVIGAVDNAKDGLLASLNQLGCVDTPYIASLYRKSEAEVVDELGSLIFFDPAQDMYVPADEYLSGNVREKLRLAEACDDPRTRGNSEALREVLPEDLTAEEIDVTLGTPWIPAKDVQRFLADTMDIAPSSVSVEYVAKEALWRVRVGSGYRVSAAASSEFGTEEVDAFTLAEQALNMRTPTVRKKIPGGPGESDTYVLDQEGTLAAREKQAELKQRFSDWIFEDEARRDRLVRHYNEHFNNIRLREFDGSHLSFPRMSKAITMRPHQKDAIWRNMSSGNTLLSHVVGAGKTFTMVASGMEMRRTGLAKKPLYVVPNHMLEQFSREFLTLYPDANILVASKDDLSRDRRQLLKARIATGDWDGIVMTHSSFEKIAMSPAFQAKFLGDQLEEYEELVTTVKDRSLSHNLTKRIEKLKAARKEKLGEMARAGAKDGGLYFDELGVDHVFVDEAHMFKNLETPTKMDRVAGIATGGSNRAFDLLMKSRYLQSRTPGRGITFATGTPVSNSLGEMYTMMRYLAPELLRERGIEHFDAWAAAFGEVINALEISPDGQSLRVNSRFAKFKNLPELLCLFRVFADVQTGSMLDLPVPAIKGGKPEVIAAPMSESQMHVQDELVARYDRVRSTKVDPREDNALKIITDGRKLALDSRLVDPSAEDDPDSKVNMLVDRVYDIWLRTRDERSTQMIFCDMGVNETEWGFSVYNDIIAKLEARGVPRSEIASISDAGTDQKKEALFSNVRAGQVRILLGSTTKMGTGTNVQDKLVALHHLDPPWRPADIEQREGRILRQGNGNKEVDIYRYVTEGSFDAYMWQTLETKAKFIAQAMAGDAGTRRADDIGGVELSFAEVKAIASGNPAMMVLAEMDLELRQLSLLRKAHRRDQAKIEAQRKLLPEQIRLFDGQIAELEDDVARRQDTKGDAFVIHVGERTFKPEKQEKKTARQRGEDALKLAVAKAAAEGSGRPMPWEVKLGELGGFDVVLKAERDALTRSGKFSLILEGAASYHAYGIANPKVCPPLVQHLEHRLRSFDGRLAEHRATRDKMAADLERYRERAGLPFGSEAEYQQLLPLRDRLRTLLSRQESGGSEEDVPGEIGFIIDAYRDLSLKAEPRGEKEAPEVIEVEPARPAGRDMAEPEAREEDAVETEILEAIERHILGSEPPEASERETAEPVPVEAPPAEEPVTVETPLAEPAEPESVDSEAAPADAAPAEAAPEAVPAAVATVRTAEQPGRGQLALFGTQAKVPSRERLSRRAKPIKANVVQLGLFDSESARSELPGKIAVEARALRPAAHQLRQDEEPAPAGGPEEASRWRESLSSGDRMDLEDMMDSGGYAGAPEPTERAVLGRFTDMVGNRPRLAEIIHDSIEHFEPFGSMVERIEREAGRDGRPLSPAEIRGAKSLYNAALARKSGWDQWR